MKTYTITENELLELRQINVMLTTEILEPSTSAIKRLNVLRQSERATELLKSIGEDLLKGELHNFANADEQDLELDVDQYMVKQHGHERAQFTC